MARVQKANNGGMGSVKALHKHTP